MPPRKSAGHAGTGTAASTKTQKRGEKKQTSKKGDDSSELLEEIQKALKGYTDSHLFIGKAIPPAKLANAIGAYAPRVSPQDVLVLYDNTMLGGAKDGLLLTSDAVYWHNAWSDVGQLRYVEIESVEFCRTTSHFFNAKILLNRKELDVKMVDPIPQVPAFTEKNRLGKSHC